MWLEFLYHVCTTLEVVTMTDQSQSTVFRFRCDPVIRAALESAASNQMITASAYARRAVARTLQADGAIIPARPDIHEHAASGD